MPSRLGPALGFTRYRTRDDALGRREFVGGLGPKISPLDVNRAVEEGVDPFVDAANTVRKMKFQGPSQ